MDKKTLLGIVLIGIIMIVWMIYSSSEYREIPPEQKSKIDTVQDTTRANNNANDIDSTTSIENTDSASIINKFGTHFAHFANATEELIKIETDLYSAIISNKGGSLVLWQLNQYKKWDKTPTQLINESETELFLKFTTIDAKKIDSRELYFNVSTPPDMQLNPNIRLVGDQSKELIFTLDLGDGKQLIKKITFYGDKYHIDQDIQLNNLDGILKGGYTLIWGHNLNYQEANCDDESNNSNGLISMNGEVDDFDVDDTEAETKDIQD